MPEVRVLYRPQEASLLALARGREDPEFIARQYEGCTESVRFDKCTHIPAIINHILLLHT